MNPLTERAKSLVCAVLILGGSGLAACRTNENAAQPIYALLGESSYLI